MPDPFTHDPFELDDDPPLHAASSAAMPWLTGLNAEQTHAVETTEGPLLVLSGAGTGKTKVLTTRVAHILLTGRCRPWNVLAVTFTNKAAREMRHRVAGLVGPAAEQVWLGTFHALGVRLLRRHAELVGLQSNFTILDTDDQIRLLKQVMEGEAIDPKRWPAPALMGTIQRWKDRGLTPERVVASGADGPADAGAEDRAPRLYGLYQARLKALNACDFGDLLLHCLVIFQDPANAAVLATYQQQFRYILVDEYQDTNVAQYLWLRLLAQGHRNLCCVGDDDQSIYSWRGAEVENILRFERDFPGAQVVRLEANYRSTPTILAAAAGLIRHNAGRLGKTLRSGRDTGGDDAPVVVRSLWDGEDEARWVVEEIEAEQRRGVSLNQMAILVRAGFQTREFEERLVTTGIPYAVIGGLRFYERQEIRDALAYFRVVAQPADDLAFERIINLPKRGLGDSTLQALHMLSRHQQIGLVAAARRLVVTDDLKPKPRATLAALLDDLDRWGAMLAAVPHTDLAQTILDESGYIDMWRRQSSPDAQGRVENLKELVAALDEFETLQVFLDHVSLVMENEDSQNAERVAIMTLHGAKGLEFDVVFLPGWEEGVFPHQRALADAGAKGLEEERRLAYVGLTRARHRAVISYAASRRIYNQWQSLLPSRFIGELPSTAVAMEGERGLFGGVAEQAASWAAAGTSGGYVTRKATPQATPSAAGATAFAIGGRVFHQKFGYGRIVAVESDKLAIMFDISGLKKVLDSFVAPA